MGSSSTAFRLGEVLCIIITVVHLLGLTTFELGGCHASSHPNQEVGHKLLLEPQYVHDYKVLCDHEAVVTL